MNSEPYYNLGPLCVIVKIDDSLRGAKNDIYCCHCGTKMINPSGVKE